MTTNGTRDWTDIKSAMRADTSSSRLNDRSVEDRLEALRQTIRTWDWRAGVVGATPPASDVAATAPPMTTTTFTEIHEDSESLVSEPSPLLSVSGAQPLVMNPTPRSVGFAPPTEPLTHPVVAVAPRREALAPSTQTFDAWDEADDPPREAVALRTEISAPSTVTVVPPVEVAPPPEVDPALDEAHGDQRVDGTSSLEGPEPETEPETEPDGRLRRLWSHRVTKLAVLGLAALVVVVLIIGGIRLFAKNPGSPGSSATTVTRPASRSVHHNHFVAPISAAQLTQYQRYAATLQNANLTAISGFEKAGSTPTPTQVVLVVVAYRTAVNNYYFQLHFIHWPQSMQSAIENDYAQLQALKSVLQAFAFVAHNGVPAWLSQLHNRTGMTQAADNIVRQDLGLPASFSFP